MRVRTMTVFDVVDFVRTVKQLVPLEVKEYYYAALNTWSSPSLWVLVAIVLVWERLQPAEPAQPLLSRGAVQDFLWFNLDIALAVSLIPALAGGIRLLYDRVTGGQVLSVASSWPSALRIVLAVLVVDFLFYCKHWLIHRFLPLWHFHAIHHSQREMNMLTDRRQHVVEHLFTQTLVFVPLIALGLKPMAVMAVGAFLWWHTLLIHANIRTNFGPLGWIFVSPQFHRVHHSIELRHWDQNFGAFVTFWDRMFGTMYYGVNEYPKTGVEDVHFPPPTSFKPHEWLADMGRQLWHPFRALLKLR